MDSLVPRASFPRLSSPRDAPLSCGQTATLVIDGGGNPRLVCLLPVTFIVYMCSNENGFFIVGANFGSMYASFLDYCFNYGTTQFDELTRSLPSALNGTCAI